MCKDGAAGWGPDRRPAAVSITFDNLGEAADIAMGRWPADAPVGQHYTATVVLPRLIDALPDVAVTYFIEGVNAERYPAALQAWRDAGHEIGLHGWVHENWEALEPNRQRADLQRSLATMKEIGVRPLGFRPPGGALSPAGMALLREFGFAYCSPVAEQLGDYRDHDLQVLPFHWHQVDAYLIDAGLGQFREANGDRAGAATADEWRETLSGHLSAALAQGEHLTVIFHPYLLGADAGLMQVLMDFIAMVKVRDDVWLASSGTVADWLASTPPRAATDAA